LINNLTDRGIEPFERNGFLGLEIIAIIDTDNALGFMAENCFGNFMRYADARQQRAACPALRSASARSRLACKSSMTFLPTFGRRLSRTQALGDGPLGRAALHRKRNRSV
jgi:hypothetical protein